MVQDCFNNLVCLCSKHSVYLTILYHVYTLQIKNMSKDDVAVYQCVVDFGDNQKITADVPVFLEQGPTFSDNITKDLIVSTDTFWYPDTNSIRDSYTTTANSLSSYTTI